MKKTIVNIDAKDDELSGWIANICAEGDTAVYHASSYRVSTDRISMDRVPSKRVSTLEQLVDCIYCAVKDNWPADIIVLGDITVTGDRDEDEMFREVLNKRLGNPPDTTLEYMIHEIKTQLKQPRPGEMPLDKMMKIVKNILLFDDSESCDERRHLKELIEKLTAIQDERNRLTDLLNGVNKEHLVLYNKITTIEVKLDDRGCELLETKLKLNGVPIFFVGN